MSIVRPALFAASLSVVASSAAMAVDLIAYEGFNYNPSTTLVGLNGGSGWSGAWGVVQNIPTGIASGGGLTWPNLQTTGNCAVTPAYGSSSYSIYSRVLAPYTTTDGVVYVSFLFEPMFLFGEGGGLEFGSLVNGMIVGAHPGTGYYGLMDTGFNGANTTVPVQEGVTALCVVRITNNFNGTITYGMWVNPPLTATPPTAPEASYTMTGTLPTAVKILNDGGFLTDEIRVGKTFGSVLPSLPPACAGDFNDSGAIDAGDLAILLGAWGGPGGDVDGNGTTDAADLAFLLGSWGTCPS